MTISNLWMYIYGWKEFICLAAACTIAAAIWIPQATKKFDYRNGKGFVLYFLYGRTPWEMIYSSAVILEVIFVLSCILFQRNIEMECLFYLGLTAIILTVTGRKWKFIVIEVLNGIFLMAALICGNIIFRYLQEVRLDSSVLVLYVLVNILMIVYMAYFAIWHFGELHHTDMEPINQWEEEGSDEDEYQH